MRGHARSHDEAMKWPCRGHDVALHVTMDVARHVEHHGYMRGTWLFSTTTNHGHGMDICGVARLTHGHFMETQLKIMAMIFHSMLTPCG